MAFGDYKHEESFHNNQHNVFEMVFLLLDRFYHDVNRFDLQQIKPMLPKNEQIQSNKDFVFQLNLTAAV